MYEKLINEVKTFSVLGMENEINNLLCNQPTDILFALQEEFKKDSLVLGIVEGLLFGEEE